MPQLNSLLIVNDSCELINEEEINFDGLKRSCHFDQRGKIVRFSTRADYFEFLIQQGDMLSSESTLRPETVLAIQRNWHLQGQTGCKFAQILARQNNYHWRRIVVFGVLDSKMGRSIANTINLVTNCSVWDTSTELISFIFPDIVTYQDLNHLLKTLSNLNGWTVQRLEQVELQEQTTQALHNVAVRVRIGSNGTQAWVLGFGSFESLVATRRSPFTEITFRTKVSKSPHEHLELNQDGRAIHLADVPMDLSPRQFNIVWAATKLAKQCMLMGVKDSRAKAKATFAVPTHVWENIWQNL